MEKMDGKNLDLQKENIKKIKELFPTIVTEKGIDFELLKLLLGDEVDESKEKYGLMWNGKGKSVKVAQYPSTSTLLPVREKSKNWDSTSNVYIEGDNLEALKLLQKTYYGRIRCIYIDPPYNTGKNLIYKNDFSMTRAEYLKSSGQTNEDGNRMVSNPKYGGKFHSNWLSMMYQRLLLARNLLSEEGVLICAIDENEVNTLGMILDEIFNSEQHCITIVHNPRGVQGTNFSYTHEYAYFVFKSEGKRIGNRIIPEEEIDYAPLRNWGSESLRTDAKNCFYPVIVRDGEIVGFGDVVADEVHPEQTEKHGEEYYVYPIDRKGIERKWRYARQSVESVKDMLKVRENNGGYDILLGKNFGSYKTVWMDSRYDANQYGKQLLNELVPNNPFDFPKSIYTTYDCVAAVVKDDKEAIVLDFFSGSATTAHAVMLLNSEDNGQRKFIMVQYPDEGNDLYPTTCDVGEERIKKAGEKIISDWTEAKDREGIRRQDNTRLSIDTGFKVFRIDSTNINLWNNKSEYDETSLFATKSVFKADRSREDILYEIMLKYGIFDQPVEEIEINGKRMYRVGQRHMIVCLEDKIDNKDIEEICMLEPRIVVFKEDGFKDDNAKINAEYNLKKSSVEDVKCI